MYVVLAAFPFANVKNKHRNYTEEEVRSQIFVVVLLMVQYSYYIGI